jgi:hypothetical protein
MECTIIPEIPKKKRGRKKKDDAACVDKMTRLEITTTVAKKRGRKPKGGKIILKQPDNNIKTNNVANIILHLKCSLNDLNEYNTKISKMVKNPLEYDPSIPPDIKTYSKNELTQFSSYNETSAPSENADHIQYDNPLAYNKYNTYKSDSSSTENNKMTTSQHICAKCNSKKDGDLLDMKEINMKLKKIKINLYKNSCQDKKSACFWCTYDYDNPECYIPKHEIDNKIYGYGSFCRPECAVAYLMKENIDDSTKFERYHLLNQIYSKVYDYKKNIKPAPNPHFLLEKFYGNLSIQEYRKLLKTEHMLLVIDKPMTRILPELHEDNELFVLGNMNTTSSPNTVAGSSSTTNTSGIYKVKRQSEKVQNQNKNTAIKESFSPLLGKTPHGGIFQ